MSGTIITWLLLAGGLSAGIMAGVYFVFSAFAMKALDEAGPGLAADVMNRINRVILASAFMPLFFGSTLILLLLLIAGVVSGGDPRAPWLIGTGALYCLGMFLCTVGFNVPLNHQLQAVGGESAPQETADLWRRYVRIWTRWNHVRTVSSGLTCAACLGLLAAG